MSSKRVLASLCLTVVLASGSLGQNSSAHTAANSRQTGPPGSAACAGCHAEIYKTYSKTVMAGASGAAADGVITGEFVHKASGVRYRVYEKDGTPTVRSAPADAGCARGTDGGVRSSTDRCTVWMSYEREKDSQFRGERELLYFIGSGVKGRSYLFSVQGFLFETPINWYSQEHRWNMTPAYTEARESPMNLPSYVDCLNCHTSGLQAPVAGTDSKYSGKPFLHGGITCQRCHGEGAGHGTADVSAIVNPAKLSPERRDAICMECHFEGTVAVAQAGKQLYQFQPGERLADYIHYFLVSDGQAQKAQAVSQFEALSLSACKRKSGDKMWCGSCHDPHSEPSTAEKAAYYRGKCLSCHGEAFAAKHHPDKADCVACHMPALPSKDVAHTEATDHRILRYPNGPQLESPQLDAAPRLVSFPERDAAAVTTRDLALAWESLAQRGLPGAARQAEQYLRKAVEERPEDAVLLTGLGFVEQEHGHEKEARELYERALKADPLSNDAATNLGTLEARAGHARRAVELWQGAFARAPHRSAIGMNLAMTFCAAGQMEDARRYVRRVLEFNPDFGKAKELLGRLNADPARCR